MGAQAISAAIVLIFVILFDWFRQYKVKYSTAVAENRSPSRYQLGPWWKLILAFAYSPFLFLLINGHRSSSAWAGFLITFLAYMILSSFYDMKKR
jgi:ABC-type Fe3+ transport system permease subunit